MTQVSRSDAAPWTERPAVWRASYLALLLAAAWLLWGRLASLGLTSASRLAMIIALATLVSAVAAAPGTLWAPSSVFLVVLFIFHFGLVALTAVGIDPVTRAAFGSRLWYVESADVVEAIMLSTVGFAATALGVAVAHGLTRLPHLPRRWTDWNRDGLRVVAMALGNGMVVGFVFGWFALGIRRGGLTTFVRSYAEFRDVTESISLPFLYFGIAAGLVLMAASGWDRRHLIGLSAFATFAVAALAVGVRTETLLPVAAAVVVLTRAERAPRARTAIIALLIGLSLVAVVRGLRQSGVSEVEPTSVSLSPVDAVIELGSGLRPVVVVLEWRDEGDDYLWGNSYWGPVQRSLSLAVPGWDRPPADEDERLLNVVVAERVGTIGFSIFAEAHRNFGGPGMAAVMVVFGFLVGMFDRWQSSPLADAVVGYALLHLLRHVRNSFTPIPVEMFMSAVVLGIAIVAAALYQRAAAPPAEPRPALR